MKNDRLEARLVAIAEAHGEDKVDLAQPIQEIVRKECITLQERRAKKVDENGYQCQLQFKHLFTLLPAKGQFQRFY